MSRRIRFDIEWEEIPRIDGATGKMAQQGWYIDGVTGGGPAVQVGPGHYEPGYATLDEALGALEAWADERGFQFSKPMVQIWIKTDNEEED